ncbi:MAG: Uma2 family endonuclease [Planctomycetaceae bacterium]
MNATATDTRRYTPEDLLTMPDGDRYELIDGHLLELEMNAMSSLVGLKLNRRIDNFVEAHALGWAFQADCTYQCFPHRPGLVRRPDGSFIRRGRLPREQLERGHVRVSPDLAIEVVSPNDLAAELEAKILDYFLAGVRLVWVVYPESRTLIVHRPGGSMQRLRERDDLCGEEVLPGFTCRIAELFPAELCDESQSSP